MTGRQMPRGKCKNLFKAARIMQNIGRKESFAALVQAANVAEIPDLEKRSQISKGRQYGVSIIMPAFKSVDRISRAMDSILAQTECRNNFEVVVILNGPQDGTEELLRSYIKRFPDVGIKIEKCKLESASAARNVGLRAAEFSYSTFLDDDDYISHTFVSSLLENASPDRIVFSEIVDFTDGDQNLSPITKQVRQASNGRSGFIESPFDVRGILAMTCAKLAPTATLLRYEFESDLKSGEDVVFWTEVILDSGLLLYATADYEGAVYYRELRPGSVSRRADEYKFSVTERLEVITRIKAIEERFSDDISLSEDQFLKSRYSGQSSFISNYLKKYPGKYVDFLCDARDFHVGERVLSNVNTNVADSIIVSYCFPPTADTSALIAMKRLIGWEKPAFVISNKFETKRAKDLDLLNIVSDRIAEHIEIDTPASFSNSTPIQSFADQALAQFTKLNSRNRIKNMYSRAMWPGSTFAAALIKLKFPEVNWVAEFSDPMLLDIHGNERNARLDMHWLRETGIRQCIGQLAPGLKSDDRLFLLAELLPFILADQVVFTNENQRNYMLEQNWAGDIRSRVLKKSKILKHPTLPREYYDLGVASIPIDCTKANIGYFGRFYATRGLTEILQAIETSPSAVRQKILLHVVCPDVQELQKEIDVRNLREQVKIYESLKYFDCLASLSSMDYLLVNDAVTLGKKKCNPYLPSKLSDYLGSGKPIWALEENGSPLSTASLPKDSIRSELGDVQSYLLALADIVNSQDAKWIQKDN